MHIFWKEEEIRVFGPKIFEVLPIDLDFVVFCHFQKSRKVKGRLESYFALYSCN